MESENNLAKALIKQLEAENLQMRKGLERLYDECPCEIYKANICANCYNIEIYMETPFTAHLARVQELMREVLKRFRTSKVSNQGTLEALKELSDYEANIK